MVVQTTNLSVKEVKEEIREIFSNRINMILDIYFKYLQAEAACRADQKRNDQKRYRHDSENRTYLLDQVAKQVAIFDNSIKKSFGQPLFNVRYSPELSDEELFEICKKFNDILAEAEEQRIRKEK